MCQPCHWTRTASLILLAAPVQVEPHQQRKQICSKITMKCILKLWNSVMVGAVAVLIPHRWHLKNSEQHPMKREGVLMKHRAMFPLFKQSILCFLCLCACACECASQQTQPESNYVLPLSSSSASLPYDERLCEEVSLWSATIIGGNVMLYITSCFFLICFFVVQSEVRHKILQV